MPSFLETIAASGALSPNASCLPWANWLPFAFLGPDFVLGLASATLPAVLATVVLHRAWRASRALAIGAGAIDLPSFDALQRANAELLAKQQEMHAVELEMRDREARYRASFKLAPTALHTLDGDMRILAVSERWCQLFGYTRDEVVGRDIYDLMDPEMSPRPRIAQDLQQLLQGDGLMEFERRFRRRDGTGFDALVTARAECMPHSQLRIHSAVQDITERKAATAELHAAHEDLAHSRRMEAIGQLTGGVAHDVNNMLQAMRGNLKLIEDTLRGSADLDEAARQKMRRRTSNALAACDQAARTSAQLLTVARRSQLDPRPIDPVELVRSLEMLCRTLAAPHGGIEFRLEVAHNVGACHADPGQLKAALLNMVKNSCDALGERAGGGTITFVLSRAELTASEGPDTPKPGEYVRIAVVDDGPGMTAEVRARALEPFFTTKPQGAGTGLGLSQTFGYARQSGGTVRIDSAPGAGCSVAILLPRTGEVLHDSETDAADALPMGQGECILIAEDEPLVRETLAGQLEELGYQTIETETADQALAVLQSQSPQVAALLTDNAMPGSMMGMELLAVVRDRFPGVPALLMTGRMDRPVAEVTALGARFLPKPYERDDLARSLREMLAASSSRPVSA